MIAFKPSRSLSVNSIGATLGTALSSCVSSKKRVYGKSTCRGELSLIFGAHDYGNEDDSPNTRWIFRKDLQGPPYMESLIYRPFDTEMNFQMNSDFDKIYEKYPFIIAPRIELWLDLNYIQKCDDSEEIGEIMLGSWTQELVTFFNEHEKYKSLFTRKGSRNFHYEKISVKELPFSKMADRLTKILSLIGNFRMIS